MRYKKVLIILCAVLLFLAALTSYVNRVMFPQLIKKIAVERIEEMLKRKVEIGSIHFNWIRGFIINKIKIYEKGSDDAVFAQADQVSFGIIIFPGFKHYRITIPFINVRSPSAHLIRTGENIWNFSDMYTPATPAVTAPAFELAWGGITVSDGKFLVEDVSTPDKWSEFFDNINLKLSLSYKGISYDFTADIPGKKGFIGATVYYQPVTQNTQAQIHLENIDTASYLSLVTIPGVHLSSGVIKVINLNIDHSQDKTSAQGDVFMKDLDISNQGQSFKGDIQIRDLDAQYRNGDITAHGQMDLTHMQTEVPGLDAGGSVQTRVNEFEMTKEGLAFSGSFHAQDIFVNLKDRQVRADGVNLDNIKIKKDQDGIQSVASVTAKGLFVQWPDQKLQGDIALKDVTMRMKDENDITLEGELRADNFLTSTGDKNIGSQHVLLEGFRLKILDQKNIALNTPLSMDEMTMSIGKNISASGSIKTERFLFDMDDGIIKISTILDASKGRLVIDDHKTIEADPQLELNLQFPLSDPQQLTYKGSITLSDATILGFDPIQSLDNVELDADFQNDEATINALSANLLDTNVRAFGTVKNFKHPVLNIIAEADELNLIKIKDLAPQIVDQYGLSFDGTSSVKVQFKGLASSPLTAKIQAVASFKNVSVLSSKLHQGIKNMTGIIEATPDSLKWRDTTATYQGQKYALAGSMDDLKNPKIHATIDGPGLQLKADLVKNRDLITINTIAGKYLNMDFDNTGSITLAAGQAPVFDIKSTMSLALENLIKVLPAQQKKSFQPLNPAGIVSMTSDLKGSGLDWKYYHLNATVTSPVITILGYSLTGMKISIDQGEGKLKNLTFDGNLYDGTVHAVGSLDLTAKGMPYDLALNIDSTDLHKLKMDSPLKMEEIDGKFFLTTIAHGTVADFKNNLHATGSLAIRDGFLAEFNLFKGLLSVLNDALRLGQVEITDVDGNFTVDGQKINTDNLRFKGPTIVLLGKGWVNFDEICDLNMTVDLSSGIVPAIAHDVLSTLNIHIYDKIDNPKFKRKISVPQVINSLLKNLLQ
jgi:AsmA-like C-terminal region